MKSKNRDFPTMTLGGLGIHCTIPIGISPRQSRKTIGNLVIAIGGGGLAYYGVKCIFAKSKKAGNNKGDSPSSTDDAVSIEPYYKVEKVSSMMERKAKEPQIEPLVGNEIYPSERVVIASGTGVGKSIFTTQLALGLASGQPSGLLPEEIERKPMRVLLVDSEMDEDDWDLRYREIGNRISSNLVRMACAFNDPEECIEAIEETIKGWTGDMALDVDNITNLFNTTAPNRARVFFNHLRDLQKRYEERTGCRMTIFVVTHDKKNANGKPMENIMGTGNLVNFATKVVKLECGEGKERTLLFPKSRKSDNASNRLIHYTMSKEGGWLHLQYESEEFVDADLITEVQQNTSTHLQQESKVTKETKLEIYQRKRNGESVNSLAQAYDVNRNTIKKYIEQVENGKA